MLSQRFVGTMLVVWMSVASLVFGVTSVWAVSTEVAYRPRPSACPSGRCGPCMCTANVYHWGYYARQWRPWPGDSIRQTIVFPQSLGVEAVAAPRGAPPRPLPKEKYGKPKRVADSTVEIEIREGAPVETVETPTPLEYGPVLEQGPRGLDFQPPGPSLK